MRIKIVTEKIGMDEVREIAEEFYGSMIKGVADIEEGVIALGGEYHTDANVVMNEAGFKQENIWGFNINIDEDRNSESWLEYIALINIRPAQNNKGMYVENETVRNKIKEIIGEIIK